MYTHLVPITLYGWVFFTISLFFLLTPQRAVVIAVIGGTLLLPEASFDLPGLPLYNKFVAISIGLLLGGILSGSRRKYRLKMTAFDIPMISWCFIVPIATSLSNGLGFYDGFSTLLRHYLIWGVSYWTGRRYFNNAESLRTLTWGILIGGIIYIPLILFEVRMSPQLSNIVYGFFPHSWIQHLRYGGYRPIVFMRHGLLVSLWMAIATTTAYWLWQSGEIKKTKKVSMIIIVPAMIITTVLCKSANAWFFLSIGILSFTYYKRTESTWGFRIIFVIILFYMLVRLSGIISTELVEKLADFFFDDERVYSLSWRLMQEVLFGERALEHPLFGWGGYGRGWPVDQATGEQLIQMVDSMWVITLNTYGFLGLLSLYLSLGLGPWCVLKFYDSDNLKKEKSYNTFKIDAIVLSFIVIITLIDSLLNTAESPVYNLIAATLLGHFISTKTVPKHKGSQSIVR